MAFVTPTTSYILFSHQLTSHNFTFLTSKAETQSIAYGREKSRRVPATVKITPTRPDREISSLILEGDPYRAWCARYKTHKVFVSIVV